MLTTTKPFLALTAADLMTPDVVMIPKEMSLRTAAHMLAQHQITGAPVVDAMGRCVGVISATDFMRWADEDRPTTPEPNADSNCVCSEWQVMDLEEIPTDEVARYMTPDPVTVAPAITVGQLARQMLDAHIHRVVVVDRGNHPVGVVSSTDILAAVAYADGDRK
jgi:CBS domain-containing protein